MTHTQNQAVLIQVFPSAIWHYVAILFPIRLSFLLIRNGITADSRTAPSR